MNPTRPPDRPEWTVNPTPWAGDAGPDRPRLRGTRRCDVAIVGAGLTGLSTALGLLELAPDRRVVVLDAGRVACGASGRGTGLLGPRVGPALAVARRRHGDAAARAAYRWSVRAVHHVIDLVARHGIACDLAAGGQLIVAADERAAAAQAREADAARALDVPVTPVPRPALPPVAARYLGGLRYAPAATLDPAALTHGLARAGERRGLTVLEHTPVRRYRPGSPATLSTDDGEVLADRVVFAVNAFGAALSAPPGVVGLRVQAGVTARLPEAVLGALDGLRAEPLIEHGELSPYYRLTPDGRLVVGGGAVVRGPDGAAAPAPGRLRAAVRALSPDLHGVRLASTWSGPIGMTRDGLPVLGWHPRHPGLFYAGGCNGHGLAVSAYHGALLARLLATGECDELAGLPWVRPRAPWIPSGRLAGPLVERALDRYLAHLTATAGRSVRAGRTE